METKKRAKRRVNIKLTFIRGAQTKTPNECVSLSVDSSYDKRKLVYSNNFVSIASILVLGLHVKFVLRMALEEKPVGQWNEKDLSPLKSECTQKTSWPSDKYIMQFILYGQWISTAKFVETQPLDLCSHGPTLVKGKRSSICSCSCCTLLCEPVK